VDEERCLPLFSVLAAELKNVSFWFTTSRQRSGMHGDVKRNVQACSTPRSFSSALSV